MFRRVLREKARQQQFETLRIGVASLASGPEPVHKVRSVHASFWGDKTRDLGMRRCSNHFYVLAQLLVKFFARPQSCEYDLDVIRGESGECNHFPGEVGNLYWRLRIQQENIRFGEGESHLCGYQSVSVSVALLLARFGSVTLPGELTVAVSEIEPVAEERIVPLAL